MASPAVFARRIARRARQVETGASRTVRRVALAINQSVIFATPVLTGHARANWQIGIESPVTDEIDEEDKSGQTTIIRNESVIQTSKPRKSIILSNNVPYIHVLNEGSSAQAPEQFVQIAVKDAIAAISRTKVFK